MRRCCRDSEPKLLQYDIAGLIGFDNAQGAEARRAELIHFIWPGGLPATRPTVTDVPKDCPELSAVESDLVSHVRRLDVDVSGFDFHSLVFVAYPRSPAKTGPMLAIVHHGHVPAGVDQYLAAGTGDAVNTLLRKGFIVAVVQMPLACWNIDADGKLPSGQVFKIKKRNTGGHNELFKTLEPELHGGTMRFFLEPVVQTINELLAEESDSRGLLMTGLSGGGWTTHLATAVDVRIDTSIPVAGSLPLYARPFSPGSDGDMEQHYPALYRETDSDGDGVLDKATGVCSWLEIYALGASTPSRDSSSACHPGSEPQRYMLLRWNGLQVVRIAAGKTCRCDRHRHMANILRRVPPWPRDLAICHREGAASRH